MEQFQTVMGGFDTLHDLFDAFAFFEGVDGSYVKPPGLWVPLTGFPGCLDIVGERLLHGQPNAALLKYAVPLCINGVATEFQVHRSASVPQRETMVLRVRDIVHTFDAAYLKFMDDAACAALVSSVHTRY